MKVFLITICSDVLPSCCKRCDVLLMQMVMVEDLHPPHYRCRSPPLYTYNTLLSSNDDNNTTALHSIIRLAS
jgi:hypothetical protein